MFKLFLKKLFNKDIKEEKQDEVVKENNQNIKEILNKNFNYLLKTSEPGIFIIAENPDYNDNYHSKRYFLVVGKDDKSFYAIRTTSVDKSKYSRKYYLYHDPKHDIEIYLECDKLYRIRKEDFINVKYKIRKSEYNNIAQNFIKQSKNYDGFDFSYLNYPIKVGSIILRDNELFIVFYLKNNTNKYKAIKLTEEKKSNVSIFIKGKKHYVDFNFIEEIKNTDNNYVVIDYVSNSLLKKLKNHDVNNYQFGDVLSLNNSSEKIIYLTQITDTIFAADMDQLELFTGIKKYNEKQINSFYRKLTEEEIEALAKKIEKPLLNGYPIYYGAKENILSSIKKI